MVRKSKYSSFLSGNSTFVVLFLLGSSSKTNRWCRSFFSLQPLDIRRRFSEVCIVKIIKKIKKTLKHFFKCLKLGYLTLWFPLLSLYSLKMQQGLLIDFTSFPQKFIDLLDLCYSEQDSDSPRWEMHNTILFNTHFNLLIVL